MAFQLSPGINVSEIDLTTVVPSVASTIGAFAGKFAWGPVDEVVTISDELRLVDRFGKPDSNNYEYWFSASNFLAYTNNLKLVRSSNTSSTKTSTSNRISVDSFTVTSGGSGYANSNIIVSDGLAVGNAVNVAVTVNGGGAIVSLTINNPSTDGVYDYVPVFTIPNGTNAVFTIATSNSPTTAVFIKNDSNWEQNYADGSSEFGLFGARYAGALGDSLKVSVADSATFATWTYKTEFTSAPNTSDYVGGKGGSNDELHIVVIDEDGKFTGIRGSIVEKYAFLSKAIDAKDESGNTNYYKNVIANRSKYVHWLSHPAVLAGTAWGTIASNTAYASLGNNIYVSLSGGADGTVTTGNIMSSYDLFASSDTVDVSLVISGPANEAIVEHLISMVESRKDAVLFVSPEKADVVDNAGSESTAVVDYRQTLSSSSYVVMDCNWKYQYDKYNDLYRWIPMNGDIAGLCARTDLERDPWYSPGGLNRGIIKNAVKLAWNPNKTDRDTLYVNGVNPIVSFPGEGIVLYGDKTLLAKPSAFDRINVRRLFITLEKSIAKAARYSLFEFNDQFTRAQFVNMVEPYLRDVQGRRGITDFRVVCDETNNTGEVIDRNEFIGDIYVKPARSINYIQLNFVSVRTSVSFNEIVGQI
jgi:phage tail sheath protein FI